MPIIKSAKKRVKVARKAAIRNSKTKRKLKLALKAFNSKASINSFKSAQSSIDKALKKGVVHPKKASRLKSRASKKAKLNGVKISKSVKKSSTTKQKTPVKKSK